MQKKTIQILVGKNIRKIRESKGISQVVLAGLCKFERSNMSRIEAGNTNPTIYTLHIIANGLDVDISELIYPIDAKRKRNN